MTSLTCTVQRYISRPQPRGFGVLSARLPDGGEVRITGRCLGGLAPGQRLEATGRWGEHPRYGRQFDAASVTTEPRVAPDEKAILAAVAAAVAAAEEDGDSAAVAERIAYAVARDLAIDADVVEALIERRLPDGIVQTTVVDDRGRTVAGLAPRALDAAEGAIAEAVVDKIAMTTALSREDALHFVALAQLETGVELDDTQHEAAVMALTNGISVLCGGPGTGKTTILKVIVAAWRLAVRAGRLRGRITLASPTGKAAQRMREATGSDASTLHRALDVHGGTGEFRRDERLPIDAGLIVVDESSMNDLVLMLGLARGWGGAQILLVGDPDQLDPVGAGAPFTDLVASGVVPTTRLVRVRRQAEGSAIAAGAEAVRQGRMPAMSPESDLIHIDQRDPEKAAAIVADLFATFEEDGDDVQVLVPGHGGIAGSVALNRRLRDASGSEGPALRLAGGEEAREGDRIIQVTNNREERRWNGDVGTLGRVEAAGRRARAMLGGHAVRIEGDDADRLELGYALTVHKSQGSEYDVVILCLADAPRALQRRKLIHTAITRAKGLCIIVGPSDAIARSVATDTPRVTTLAARLKAMVD